MQRLTGSPCARAGDAHLQAASADRLVLGGPGLAGLELRVTAAWPGSPHSQPATPPRFSPLYSTESVQARAYLQRSPFLSHAQCSRSSGTEDAALSPRALSARSPAYSRGSFPALAVLLPIRPGGGMPVHVSFKSSRHDSDRCLLPCRGVEGSRSSCSVGQHFHLYGRNCQSQCAHTAQQLGGCPGGPISDAAVRTRTWKLVEV